MEKRIGLLIMLAATLVVLGMYLGIGFYANTWIPNGWFSAVLGALFTLWSGYGLARLDDNK